MRRYRNPAGLSVEMEPPAKIHILAARLAHVRGNVVLVRGKRPQKESRRGVRIGAVFATVNQTPAFLVQIHVELRPNGGALAGYLALQRADANRMRQPYAAYGEERQTRRRRPSRPALGLRRRQRQTDPARRQWNERQPRVSEINVRRQEKLNGSQKRQRRCPQYGMERSAVSSPRAPSRDSRRREQSRRRKRQQRPVFGVPKRRHNPQPANVPDDGEISPALVPA